MDSVRSTAYSSPSGFATLAPNLLNNSADLFVSANTSNQTRDECKFTKFEFVGSFFVQPVICAIGTVLNIISFCIFARGKQFAGSVTYRLMMVLALFDALTLLLTLPSSFVRCKPYLSICDSWFFKQFRIGFYPIHLHVAYPLINMCEGVSVFITVLLSIERYISIKYHYIIKAYFSPSNVRNLVLTLISFCLITNIPLVFVLYPKPVYADAPALNITGVALNDSESQPRGEFRYYQGALTAFGKSILYPVYTWMRIIVYNFLPLIFLAVINAFLIYIVRSSGHFRKQSSQTRSAERRMKGQRNLTILLVTVIFLFLAGQIPLAFAFIAVFRVVTGCRKIDKPQCCFLYKHYRVVTLNISLVTYGANFFVYLALNKHFRAEVSRLCRCWKIRAYNGAAPTDGGEAVEMISRHRDKNVTVITEGNGEIEANNADHSSDDS